jgi:hypothetical protein
MKRRPIIPASLCVPVLFLALVSTARADEIRLKDGSKIIGTIVGYEDDAFKVETAYGFALVRKNSIAEIVPSEPKKPAPAKAPATAAPSEKPDAKLTETSAPAAAISPSPATLSVTPAAPPAVPPLRPPVGPFPSPIASPKQAANERSISPPVAPPVAPTISSKSALAASAKSAPPIALPASPAPPPAPPAKPLPAPVQEQVSGNLYVNQTYGFQMYKPPDWNLIGDARSALPNAIAALGTNDQKTLLVVGRNSLLDSASAPGASRVSAGNSGNSDSLAAHAAATERALRQIYENYRPLPQRRSTVAGLPAIEQRFRGSLDNLDWSVIVLTFVRDTEVFTVLGMTHADDDLIQIQENVIAKTVGSLQFIAPAR